MSNKKSKPKQDTDTETDHLREQEADVERRFAGLYRRARQMNYQLQLTLYPGDPREGDDVVYFPLRVPPVGEDLSAVLDVIESTLDKPEAQRLPGLVATSDLISKLYESAVKRALNLESELLKAESELSATVERLKPSPDDEPPTPSPDEEIHEDQSTGDVDRRLTPAAGARRYPSYRKSADRPERRSSDRVSSGSDELPHEFLNFKA